MENKIYKYWCVEFDFEEANFPLDKFPTEQSVKNYLEKYTGCKVSDEDYSFNLEKLEYEIKSVLPESPHYSHILVTCPYCGKKLYFGEHECGNIESLNKNFEYFGRFTTCCPNRHCQKLYYIIFDVEGAGDEI